MEPTNNDPKTRTMNRDAAPGSKNDTYRYEVAIIPRVLTLTSQYSLVVHLRRAHIARYNPWRAPGYAPVFDPCGMAGGTPPQNAGPGEAKFAPTPWAKQGDLGSKVLAKGTATATGQLVLT